MKNRRQVLSTLVIAATAAGLPAASALAQSKYPEKPVSLVVVFGTGGTNDVVARRLSEPLGRALGQPVVVENRTGAGGNIGATSVARSTPDGYTLLQAFPGLTTGRALYKSLPYDPVKDFTPITLIGSAPSVIVANPGAETASLSSFTDYLKKRPKGANYGSAGNGTSSHLAGAMLGDVMDLKLQHVPYRGGGPALVDLAAGLLDVMVIPVPEAMPLIQAGRIKPVALAHGERSALLPAVPTTREWGLKGFEVGSWYGLSAPAGTPAAVIDKVGTAVRAVVNSPEVQASYKEQGIVPIASDAASFAAFLQSETARWTEVIRRNQISLD